MILRAILAALLTLPIQSPSSAFAAPPDQDASDYCRRQLGAWFYCAAPPPPEPPSAAVATPGPTEVAELEAFQRQIDEARKVAVWSPTPQNVERYYRLQQQALNKGGLFADEWRRMLWSNPALDYTVTRPVTEIGKHDWEDARSADRDLFLRGAAERVGLFFIFKGSCAACRTAGPLVRTFGDRYGVSIKAISADGGLSPSFPDAAADQGQLAAWGVDRTMTPALLIYQSPDGADGPRRIAVSDGKVLTLRACRQSSGCLTYLGAGVLPVEDMAERLFVMLATRSGEDF